MRIAVLLSLFSLQAFALEIPVKDGDVLVVRGLVAQVNYTAAAGQTALKLGDLSGGWTWRKDGNSVFIEGQDPDSRSSVASALKSPPSRVVLDIHGPSLPIDVSLRDGGVQLVRGSHEAALRVQQGKVTASQRTGGLRVSGRRLDVAVNDCSGRLEIDVFQGNVSVAKHDGNADVEIFGGQFSGEQSKGTLTLTTRNAPAKVQKFNGTLQVDLEKGNLIGSALQGRVEGRTDDGNVQLQILKDTDVSLQSQSGRVTLQIPSASGAWVNFVTGSGDIYVPGDLKVSRTAAEKSLRGRLKGERSSMSLIVRSAEGSIVVK